MSNKDKEVTFKFETKEQAEAFMDWFSNEGEQHYWDSCKNMDEAIRVMVPKFIYNYHEIIGIH
jgi:hypothetical protein